MDTTRRRSHGGPLIRGPDTVHICRFSTWSAHLSAPSYCTRERGITAPFAVRGSSRRGGPLGSHKASDSRSSRKKINPIFPVPLTPVASFTEYIIPSRRSDMRPPGGSLAHSLPFRVNESPFLFPTPPPSLHNGEGSSRSPLRGPVTDARRAPPVYFSFFFFFEEQTAPRIHSKYPRTHPPLRETDHSRPPSR